MPVVRRQFSSCIHIGPSSYANRKDDVVRFLKSLPFDTADVMIYGRYASAPSRHKCWLLHHPNDAVLSAIVGELAKNPGYFRADFAVQPLSILDKFYSSAYQLTQNSLLSLPISLNTKPEQIIGILPREAPLDSSRFAPPFEFDSKNRVLLLRFADERTAHLAYRAMNGHLFHDNSRVERNGAPVLPDPMRYWRLQLRLLE